MDAIQSLYLGGIERKPGNAVLVFPMGDIEVNAFIRLLLLVSGLPEQVLLVRPHVELVPHLPDTRRTELTGFGIGMQVVDIRFGFQDEPDIPLALSQIDRLDLDPSKTRYYVIDDRGAAVKVKGMSCWRRWLFVAMSAACISAAEYFHLPQDTTTEIPIHPRCPATEGTKR